MYDVITIGTASRDVFLKGVDVKALQGGEKKEIDEPIFTYGGGALNTAVTFSRQGFKTAALLKIGDDETAENILRELKKEKITPLAICEKNKTTAFSTILLSASGERTILVYRGASEDLEIKEIPFNKLNSRFAYIAPGRIPFEVVEKIFNHFYKNRTQIAFNPSKYYLDFGLRKLKPLLNMSKIVSLNREEAAYLTAINYQRDKEIFRELDSEVNGIAIMTDDSRGVMVSDGENIYSAGIFDGKLINRTGAGDAFSSGFTAGIMRKNNIGYAIRLGSANATSVVEKIGATKGILTKSEFEKHSRWQNFEIKITQI